MITEFTGENRYLSNFYPCDIRFNGLLYRSSEAAYQAQKLPDPDDREGFTLLTPGEAKKAGRSAVLRSDWEQVKKMFMLEILLAKFRQHGTLLERLLSTGDQQLIEGNRWHDNYWGTCTCEECLPGIGTNMLGKLLMVTRAVYSPDA